MSHVKKNFSCKAITLAITSIFFASLLLGCSSSNEPLPKIKVAISKTPLTAPLYIAKYKGFFKKQGVDVSFIEVIGGHRSFNKMIQEEADIATSSDSVIMFNAFKRSDFSVLGTFVQSSNDIKLITTKSSQIENINSLKGKTVGVIKNTASEYFIHSSLLIHGLNHTDINFKNVKPLDIIESLQSGDVDAISVWEPFPFKTKETLKENFSLIETRGIYNLSFNLLSKNDYIKNNKDKIIAFMKAIQEAIVFIHNNQKKSKSILIASLATSPQFIDWIWQDYLFKFSLNSSLALNLDNQAQWAINNKIFENKSIPNFYPFLNADLIKSINPSLSDL